MPERSEESSPAEPTQGDLASLTKAAGKFIGWLSGSLAAVTGILYGFGYLITLSNLHSLGLDFYLFDFDPSLYLTRGANFVLYFTRAISQTLFFLIVLTSPLLAIAYFLYRFWLKDRFLAKRGKAVEYVRQYPIVWKGPIFVVLAATLFLDLWPRYEVFSEILGISHILYEPQVSGLSPEIEMIRSAISNQGSQSDTTTATVFFNCQLFLIEAVVLLYLAWRVTTTWRFRVLLIAPYVLIFAMFVVTLPMIYGIVIISNEFSAIRVTTDSTSQASRSDELYLLSKSGDEFILWDDEKRQVLWLPLGSVKNAEIGARKPLPAHRQSDD